jgi:aquaporin Z|uniref:Major intrinsic protein n=1 Tax=viral metagenome TaxID=1070528 RepID=A0A6C0ET98_9ZZZZ
MEELKYFVEFIGTFIFLSVILITGEAIPIGLTLAAMIYWGGKISGGAFNPAVSLALYLNKKINVLQMSGYMLAEFLGALLAFYFFKIKA